MSALLGIFVVETTRRRLDSGNYRQVAHWLLVGMLSMVLGILAFAWASTLLALWLVDVLRAALHPMLFA